MLNCVLNPNSYSLEPESHFYNAYALFGSVARWYLGEKFIRCANTQKILTVKCIIKKSRSLL